MSYVQGHIPKKFRLDSSVPFFSSYSVADIHRKSLEKSGFPFIARSHEI